MTASWELFGSVILLGAITFVYRYSFVSEHGRRIAEKVPAEFLKLLPPATFTAIIVNNVMAHQSNPEKFRSILVVSVAALAVAWFTRSIVGTLLFGLALLYLLQNWPN